MPPRSSSTHGAICVLAWNDPEYAYDPALDEPTTTAKVPLTLTKSVRFSERNEMFFIKHIDEFSDEEVASTWFDGNEYANIKIEYKATVFMMECGTKLIEDEHTSRGLEYRTQEGAWRRYENKRDAYNAVLDEQDRQWKEDADDDNRISAVYLDHSTKCRIKAHEVGKQDAKEAQKVYLWKASKGAFEDKQKEKKRGILKKTKGSFRNMFGSKST